MGPDKCRISGVIFFPFASAVWPTRNLFPSSLHPTGWCMTAQCALCLSWARGMNKPSRNEWNSDSIVICNSCIDQKINYCCSKMYCLQLCNRDHAKEASWCKFPIIFPVSLASALPPALCSESLMWFATCCWQNCCCASSSEMFFFCQMTASA